MKKNKTLSLSEETLKLLRHLALKNHRTDSGMIEALVQEAASKDLEK